MLEVQATASTFGALFVGDFAALGRLRAGDLLRAIPVGTRFAPVPPPLVSGDLLGSVQSWRQVMMRLFY
jgi:hypothetical protein